MPRPLNTFGTPTVILTNLAGVLVDAVLQEETIDEWALSKIPRESGRTGTDHKAKKPRRYNITARLSDTPFIINRVASTAYYAIRGVSTFNGGIAATLGLPGAGGAKAAYEELRRAADSDDFLQITYGLGVLNDMQFQFLSVPRIAQDGLSLRVTGRLEQAIITSTGEVSAENIDESVNQTAVAPTDLGLQATVPL